VLENERRSLGEPKTVNFLKRENDLRPPRETVAQIVSSCPGGRRTRMRAIMALLGALAMLIAVGAAPAGADGHHGGDRHGGYGRPWHAGHFGHGHHWRGYPYFYGPPPPVFFFPPPVVYAPPPPIYVPPPPVVYLPPPPSLTFSFSWPHP